VITVTFPTSYFASRFLVSIHWPHTWHGVFDLDGATIVAGKVRCPSNHIKEFTVPAASLLEIRFVRLDKQLGRINLTHLPLVGGHRNVDTELPRLIALSAHMSHCQLFFACDP